MEDKRHVLSSFHHMRHIEAEDDIVKKKKKVMDSRNRTIENDDCSLIPFIPFNPKQKNNSG